MWEKIDQYVKEHHMIEPGDRILLGLSGGADSIALARFLLRLREEKMISFYAIHIDHQIRGEEAKRDSDFVRAFCEEWGIPYKIYQENVVAYAEEKKMSLEEAGRVIRYEKMQEYAMETDCVKIALAHHADDLAETMIFRMVRGTGPEGLAAILPVYENRIRPLLCVDKSEILHILSDLGQRYVEDSSNQETDFSRNYIRSYILPHMRKLNPQAVTHMGLLSHQLEEQNAFVKRQLDHLYEEQIIRQEKRLGIAISFFRNEDDFVGNQMIRRMLFEKCGKRKDIMAIHVDIIRELLEKGSEKYNHLPYGMVAYHDGEILWIREGLPQSKEEKDKTFYREIPKKELEEEGVYKLILDSEREMVFYLFENEKNEIPKKHCIKYFDYDKIKCMLTVRTRLEGDYLVLDHSGKKKKIRRYFIDEKVPSWRREEILLLADGNHILCVDGKRISETYKVTESTRRILKVEYPKNEM